MWYYRHLMERRSKPEEFRTEGESSWCHNCTFDLKLHDGRWIWPVCPPFVRNGGVTLVLHPPKPDFVKNTIRVDFKNRKRLN